MAGNGMMLLKAEMNSYIFRCMHRHFLRYHDQAKHMNCYWQTVDSFSEWYHLIIYVIACMMSSKSARIYIRVKLIIKIIIVVGLKLAWREFLNPFEGNALHVVILPSCCLFIHPLMEAYINQNCYEWKQFCKISSRRQSILILALCINNSWTFMSPFLIHMRQHTRTFCRR